jgi:hypothetical protein
MSLSRRRGRWAVVCRVMSPLRTFFMILRFLFWKSLGVLYGWAAFLYGVTERAGLGRDMDGQ